MGKTAAADQSSSDEEAVNSDVDSTAARPQSVHFLFKSNIYTNYPIKLSNGFVTTIMIVTTKISKSKVRHLTVAYDTACLAQSVERQALNLMVEGSSPSVGAFLFFYRSSSYCSVTLRVFGAFSGRHHFLFKTVIVVGAEVGRRSRACAGGSSWFLVAVAHVRVKFCTIVFFFGVLRTRLFKMPPFVFVAQSLFLAGVSSWGPDSRVGP